MDKEQLNARRAAAKAFMESLDKLSDSLNSPASETAKAKPQSPAPSPPPPPKKARTPQFSFADLEEAIADIEQFMQNQEHQPPEASE